MGLSLFVGFGTEMKAEDAASYERFEAQIAHVNRLLAAAGLPAHQEPVEGEVLGLEMFGYSGLHYLRRIAAHIMLNGSCPPSGDDEADEDPIIEQWYERAGSGAADRDPALTRFDHLMLHGDAEGYYVPIAFDRVLFDEANAVDAPDEAIDGGMLGSSVRLRDECIALARAMKIPIDVDPESDSVWSAPDTQGEKSGRWRGYGVEAFTCIRLHAAAVASIERGALLVFA